MEHGFGLKVRYLQRLWNIFFSHLLPKITFKLAKKSNKTIRVIIKITVPHPFYLPHHFRQKQFLCFFSLFILQIYLYISKNMYNITLLLGSVAIDIVLWWIRILISIIHHLLPFIILQI